MSQPAKPIASPAPVATRLPGPVETQVRICRTPKGDLVNGDSPEFKGGTVLFGVGAMVTQQDAARLGLDKFVPGWRKLDNRIVTGFQTR